MFGNSGFPFAESVGRQIGYFNPNNPNNLKGQYDWIIVNSITGKCYAAGVSGLNTLMEPSASHYGQSAVKYIYRQGKWIVSR